MNYAMHMHPFWGATPGPGRRRNSMQTWEPEPPDGGFGGPRGISMGDETPSPGMPDPEGTEGEPRPRGGKRHRRGRRFGGPRMDWADDPMGPMFGPGGAFRGQRGGRGRRNRGDVRASVLLLLEEQPRHGYEILTELADRSDGAWRPSPGSIYPVLKTLTEEGLVQPEQESGRRVFHLTDEGRRFVETNREAWGEPWQADDSTATPGLDELRQEAKQLFGAVRQVLQVDDEEQLRQTTVTLANARKAIYLMLAEVDASLGSTTTSNEEPNTSDEKDDANG